MPASEPAGSGQLSWSTTTSDTGSHSRLAKLVERIDWIKLAFTVLGLFVFDLCALVIGGVVVNEARCPRGQCGLGTQLQVLHDDYWLVPLILALPVLLTLVVRQWRPLVAALQIGVCAFILLHTVASAQLTDDRIHGRVPCWNPAYSPAECPWGNRGS